MSYAGTPLPKRNSVFVVAQLAAPRLGKARAMVLLTSQYLALSSRASRGICFFLALAVLTSLNAVPVTKRPKILGIGRVTIEGSVSETGNPIHFYSKLGLSTISMFQAGAAGMVMYAVNDHQELDLEFATLLDPKQLTPAQNKLSLTPRQNNLSLILFQTSDVAAIHDYLQSKQITVSEVHADDVQIKDADGKSMNGDASLFTLQDPEGHRIGFLQYKSPLKYQPEEGRSSLSLIHAGFIVRDRAATEHFYKDILGFRPYWHGGMKDGQDDWVSLQVPDGTDWIEMMVNVDANPDQRLRGIMNHIAIGVTDIHAAQQKLIANGVKLTEEPEIGRDGKWQLNVYDPDLTRIEFMEFKPVQKPCCSEFTGPHPQP